MGITIKQTYIYMKWTFPDTWTERGKGGESDSLGKQITYSRYFRKSPESISIVYIKDYYAFGSNSHILYIWQLHKRTQTLNPISFSTLDCLLKKKEKHKILAFQVEKAVLENWYQRTIQNKRNTTDVKFKFQETEADNYVLVIPLKKIRLLWDDHTFFSPHFRLSLWILCDALRCRWGQTYIAQKRVYCNWDREQNTFSR